MLPVTTTISAVSAEVMKLEMYQLSMSVSWKTLANAPNVGLLIPHVTWVVSAFGFRAVSTAQARGTSHKIAQAISTPRQIRLNSFTRRSYSLVLTVASV